MHCFLVYPEYLLDHLKRRAGLKQELSNDIDRVLQTDQEVKDLIGHRRIIEALHDPAVKDLIVRKTRPKYDELVERSDEWAAPRRR
jgi:hypothetical protein